MSGSFVPVLEDLLAGKASNIELLRTESLTRDVILKELNSLIFSRFPDALLSGHFSCQDQSSYLIYELHLSDSNSDFCSIRLLEFDDRFRLMLV